MHNTNHGERPPFEFYQNVISRESLETVNTYIHGHKNTWDPSSTYFAYRNKMIRFVLFVRGDIFTLEQNYFVQPAGYNDFSGGTKREFQLIPSKIIYAHLRPIVLQYCNYYQVPDKTVLLLQFNATYPKSFKAQGDMESVSGQGIHTDGAERAALVCFERSNVNGAANVFHRKLDGSEPLCSPTVLMPGDIVFWKDNEIYHQVLPIQSTDEHNPGCRTVLLIHSPADFVLVGQEMETNTLTTQASLNPLRKNESYLLNVAHNNMMDGGLADEEHKLPLIDGIVKHVANKHMDSQTYSTVSSDSCSVSSLSNFQSMDISQNYNVHSLTELLDQFNAAPVLGALVRKGVPDAINDDEELSVQEIGNRTGIVNLKFLSKVLRYMTSFKIFKEVDGQRFRHTENSRVLRKGNMMHSRCIWRTSPENLMSMCWADKMWEDVTGQSAFQLGTGIDYYSFLAKHSPAEEKIFGEYMKLLMDVTIPGIVSGYTWPLKGDLVDLGGGKGDLINRIALERPGLTCHLLDMPTVIAEAKVAGVVTAGNVLFKGCDFFKEIPVKSDFIIMKRILHNWDDASCVKILQKVAECSKPGFKILVIDFVVRSDMNAFDEMLRQDINMQLLFSGEERTLVEFDAIFSKAGLQRTSVPIEFSGGPYKGIELQAENTISI